MVKLYRSTLSQKIYLGKMLTVPQKFYSILERNSRFFRNRKRKTERKPLKAELRLEAKKSRANGEAIRVITRSYG